MRRKNEYERPRLLGSACVIVILGFQIAAFFMGSAALYPFRNYPMYSAAMSVNDLKRDRITITLKAKSGDESIIQWRGLDLERSQNFGMGIGTFTRRYLPGIMRKDATVAADFAARINRDRKDPVVEIRVKAEHFVFKNPSLENKGVSHHVFDVSRGEAR